MENSPLFSIITVCRNSEKTIERTIQSVLNQLESSYEYIIIDGGSDDATLDIIKKFEHRFNGKMKWISEPDDGIYDAMNKGMQVANGFLVSFLNSDDWYPETTLKIIKDYYINDNYNNQYKVFYGLLSYFSKDERLMFTFGRHHDNLLEDMIAHPTCFITRETLNSFGLFSLKYYIASDYDYLLKLYESGNVYFCYIPEILANFTMDGISGNIFEVRKEVLLIKKTHKIISKKYYYYKLITLFVRKLIYSLIWKQ